MSRARNCPPRSRQSDYVNPIPHPPSSIPYPPRRHACLAGRLLGDHPVIVRNALDAPRRLAGHAVSRSGPGRRRRGARHCPVGHGMTRIILNSTASFNVNRGASLPTIRAGIMGITIDRSGPLPVIPDRLSAASNAPGAPAVQPDDRRSPAADRPRRAPGAPWCGHGRRRWRRSPRQRRREGT